MDCVAFAQALAAGQATLGTTLPPLPPTYPQWMVDILRYVRSGPLFRGQSKLIAGSWAIAQTYHPKVAGVPMSTSILGQVYHPKVGAIPIRL